MGIAENLLAVKQKISAAAVAAGRESGAVKLIAVSKTYPVDAVQAAIAAGQVDFGENRVQEVVEKHAALPNVNWHLIGTLQRNKVRQIAGFVHLIHSVDSEKLLEEINRQAELHHRVIDCLLQINISHEEQKSGMDESEADELLARISQFRHVRILGLMGMAAFTDDKSLISKQFQSLAATRARLRIHEGPRVELRELSMGMSGDFELAIAAGATMVRIGSSIFGHR
ncbi:MAG: YggS family pyridoxal phosphate-dependent enzyme [Bacteroidetes bacterium]|nr:YggS family pyridoxal phosphate-dependent enzyme [Bacteroidota bacterium]